MKRLQNENGLLDATDVKLLCALVTDARTSIAELARLVGMSNLNEGVEQCLKQSRLQP